MTKKRDTKFIGIEGEIAQFRKIAVSSLDTGTYDFRNPGMSPEIAENGITIDDLQEMYETNPYANKAVKIKANRILGEGFDLLPQTEDKEDNEYQDQAIQLCWEFLESINYKEFFKQAAINAYVSGNEWTEIIYNSLDYVINITHGDFKTIDFRRDFINNKILFDGYGEPVGYWQFIQDLSELYRSIPALQGSYSSYLNLQAAKERLMQTQDNLEITDEHGQVVGLMTYKKPNFMYLKESEISHLSFNKTNDNPYGYSMLIPAWDGLVKIQRIGDSIVEAIDRMGFPKPIMYVGDKDHPPSETLMDAGEAAIKDPVRKEGFILPYYSKLELLPNNVDAAVNNYPQLFISQVAVGLGIPQELLLGEGTANRATSEQGSTDFEKSLEGDRLNLEKYILDILEKFLESRGFETTAGKNKYLPRIVWKKFITEDEKVREQIVMERYRTGLITFNEAREQLELNEIEDIDRATKFYDELNTGNTGNFQDLFGGDTEFGEAQFRLDTKKKLNNNLNKEFKTQNVDYKQIAQKEIGTKIKTVGKQKAKKIRDTIVNGLSRDNKNKTMLNKIKKIGNYTDAHAKTILRTETKTLTSKAAYENAKKKKLQYKVWDAVLDSKTSNLSKALNGQVRKINEKFSVDYIDEQGKKQHWEGQFPPEHPNCYDIETEVLTDKGWKYFEELNPNDKILSLNPENKNMEYQNYKNYYKYKYNGKMYNLDNNEISFCVTPNHNHLVTKTYKSGKGQTRNDKLLFRSSEKLRNTERVPQTGKWKGKNVKYFEIANKKINADTWIKFMSMYLSDGYIVQKRRGTIGIACKVKMNIVKEALKDFPFKIRYDNEKCYINDVLLWDYLKQFGKCYDKYIPKELKQLNTKQIKLFLEYYFDSHERPQQIKSDGYIYNSEKTYFTVSKKMSDDLGEIILKAGYGVSYNARENENYSKIYILRELRREYKNIIKKQINLIDYNDYVYDVELPKYHALFVRRKGKCFWSGNSRCTIRYLNADYTDFQELPETLKVNVFTQNQIQPELIEQANKEITELVRLGATKKEITDNINDTFKKHFNNNPFLKGLIIGMIATKIKKSD